MSAAKAEKPPLYHFAILVAFSAVNAALLFLFLMWLPVDVSVFWRVVTSDWSLAMPRIAVAFGIGLGLAIAGVMITLRMPPGWRASAVFFRLRFAHPAHDAFFGLKEPPFDRKPLLQRYPEVRDSAYHPEVQYATWQKLADKHAALPVIRGSQAGWRLLGDLHCVSLLFLHGFLVAWLFNVGINPTLATSYLFLFGAQAFFLLFTARGTGRRLVNNVLAVELGLHDKDGDGKDGKKNKKGKRF